MGLGAGPSYPVAEAKVNEKMYHFKLNPVPTACLLTLFESQP